MTVRALNLSKRCVGRSHRNFRQGANPSQAFGNRPRPVITTSYAAPAATRYLAGAGAIRGCGEFHHARIVGLHRCEVLFVSCCQHFHLIRMRRLVANSLAGLKVPPLHAVNRLAFVGLMPEPGVKSQLMLERGRKCRTRGAEFDVDETKTAVPTQHHVQFTGGPTVGVVEALWLVNSGVIEPGTSAFPRLVPRHGGA